MGESAQERFASPVLVKPRLGQGSFRLKVSEAYRYTCAVSETKVLPALDAAHIRPYHETGSHSVANGLLLRKDIHSVFDTGFATVDEDYRFIVSSQVKEVFNNGNEYRRLHGRKLLIPIRQQDCPDYDNLKWHRENCFLGE